jgi:heme oxygenase
MSNAPIMDRLKEETWPLHQQAERGNLEQDLMKGKLPREVYREHLAQRYLIHKTLEAKLREARGKDPRVAAVVQDWQFHEGDAATDLAFYGGDAATAAPTKATEKLLASIEAADPIALLGHQYVYEGSNNGARFIARALRGAWRLQGLDGTQYLDPYGEQQRERWAEFKDTMNAQEFTEEEGNRIVEAAKATFLQIIELEADVYPGAAAGAAS